MKAQHNFFSYTILIIVILLFFTSKTYGICIATLALTTVFLLERKLIRVFTKIGFLIFVLIALGTPLLIHFSLGKFLDNLFILLRGILIFIWLYFYTKNISSSRVYQVIKNLLPNELISLIKVSFTIIPVMQKEAVSVSGRIRSREISLFDSLNLFLSNTVKVAESITSSFDSPNKNQKIFLVTGKIHEGKTTLLSNMIDQAIKNNLKVGGIIAKYKEKPKGIREYYATDLKTGKSIKLATTERINKYQKRFLSYYFLKDGMEFALKALTPEYLVDVDVAVIDEIGAFEVKNGGYAEKIKPILESNIPIIIFVVRDTFVEKVCDKFNIKPTKIIKVGQKIANLY